METQKYLPEGCLADTEENRRLTASKEGLETALKKGIILEAMAKMCYGDLSLSVELGNDITGIIEKEEVIFDNSKETRDIAIITRVGKNICFKVKEIKEQNGKITAILSRKDAQKECYYNYISKLIPGDIIDTKITHLEHFGAFCDIGCGIISLLSVDCISVSRISHPKDRFFIGQQIKTVVKSFDKKLGRICLSRKELLGTWEENAAMFSAGMTVAGIVRSVEEYGIFIELTPNLAGLAEYREGINVGQTAVVYIKSIIPDKMKIKLVVIDSGKADPTAVTHEFISDNVKSKHIDFWQYSPQNCTKSIETCFSCT